MNDADDLSQNTSIQLLVHAALEKLLEHASDEVDVVEPLVRQAIDSVASHLFESTVGSVSDHVKELKDDQDSFQEIHEARWGKGLEWLRIHRQWCIEAGIQFQTEILKHQQFEHDPLFGVLMRLHANACRIQGEIITLLAAGYPDGAFARWRTLHEIAVTAIVLKNSGASAATDYIEFGIVQAVNGMNGFQETAARMNRAPFSLEEIQEANALSDRIQAKSDVDFKSRNGWARKYIKSSKFSKLQSAAGLDHWRNDYALASRDIHTDFRELHALLAIPKNHPRVLLVGPSDSGIVEPAHSAAITLMQATAAFILARGEEPGFPIDFSFPAVLVKTLHLITDEVGRIFMELHEKEGAEH